MPCTVRELFAAAGAIPVGPVQWGTRLPSKEPGVYIVTITDDADACTGRKKALIHPEHATKLRERWLPGEVVLYIGMTTRPLRKRLGEFYKHRLGDRRPHAGGQWIKALKNLTELHIFWAEHCDPARAEEAMLRRFKQSAHGRLPFANGRDPTKTGRRDSAP